MNISTVKTTLLLGALTGLLILVGRAVGGPGGMVIAFIFAVIFNFGSYWYSDKIVLKMYRAKEIPEDRAPQLHRSVERLARNAEIPKPKVYLVENATPNAFATGRDPSHAAVAVTTGILNLLSPEELEGVLAHEISHVKNRDTLISAIAATIAGVITLIATWARWAAIFGGMRGRDRDDSSSNLIGFLFLAILAPIAALIIQLAISRSREYLADTRGAKISGSPIALASALEKLEHGVSRRPMEGSNPSTAHMFIVNPFKGNLVMRLFSTHPPIPERVERLRKIAGRA